MVLILLALLCSQPWLPQECISVGQSGNLACARLVPQTFLFPLLSQMRKERKHNLRLRQALLTATDLVVAFGSKHISVSEYFCRWKSWLLFPEEDIWEEGGDIAIGTISKKSHSSSPNPNSDKNVEIPPETRKNTPQRIWNHFTPDKFDRSVHNRDPTPNAK